MSQTFQFLLSKTQSLNEDREIGDEVRKCKLQELYEQEKINFIKTKLKDLIKKEWNEGFIFEDFKEFYDTQIGKNDNTGYFWITINPKKDILLNEFKKTMERYVRRTFIKSYIYVYEQRASERNEKMLGDGVHSHILIERDMSANVSPYDIQKRTRIAFKNVCDSSNKNILHFKQMPKEYIIDKFNYITNKNLDDEHKDKEEKQEYDKTFREQNDLQSFYAFNSLKQLYLYYLENGELPQENQEETNEA